MDAYKVQVMVSCIFCANPLTEPMLIYFQLDPLKQRLKNIHWTYYHVHSRKCLRKYHLLKKHRSVEVSMRWCILTHRPLVPHICVIELGQHWFRLWLIAYSTPRYYLNQCWIIRPLGTNFNETLIKIQNFSFTKTHLKRSSGNGGHCFSCGKWVNCATKKWNHTAVLIYGDNISPLIPIRLYTLRRDYLPRPDYSPYPEIPNSIKMTS